MSEYPEDVMKAARKHCDLAGVTPHSEMRVHCENVAAAAIMAERERCVKITETMRVYEIGDRFMIASAIRKGGDAS